MSVKEVLLVDKICLSPADMLVDGTVTEHGRVTLLVQDVEVDVVVGVVVVEVLPILPPPIPPTSGDVVAPVLVEEEGAMDEPDDNAEPLAEVPIPLVLEDADGLFAESVAADCKDVGVCGEGCGRLILLLGASIQPKTAIAVASATGTTLRRLLSVLSSR